MNDPQDTAQTPVSQMPKTDGIETVTLDVPLTRGDKSITEVQVRRPNTGALRGTSLTEVMQLNTDAIMKVLPRCTEPALLKHELDTMDPADLVQLGSAVVGFLLPKKTRESFKEA